MAGLKDVFALIDEKLKDVFHTVTYSPTKDRADMAKRIGDTKTKFLATEPPRGRKDFNVANNVVAYSPTLSGGRKVKLQGKDVSYVPAERFSDFLDGLSAAATEGHLDKELEAASPASKTIDLGDGGKTVTANYGGERKARKPRADAGKGWSDERRARFAASIAKRNAAKAGGA